MMVGSAPPLELEPELEAAPEEVDPPLSALALVLALALALLMVIGCVEQ